MQRLRAGKCCPARTVPGRAAQGSRPKPGDGDPLPVQLGDIPQHLPGQPVPEPAMGIQLSAEPADLPEGDRPDSHIRDTGHPGIVYQHPARNASP